MTTKQYDLLIVGAGLFGATFACLAYRKGLKCLVIDKRPHLGGNVYCEKREGINVHKYGAHIFHTSNKEVWDFVMFNWVMENVCVTTNRGNCFKREFFSTVCFTIIFKAVT